MILVDTSVWVDHLRSGNAHLIALLHQGVVASHEFVLGELAVGNLKNRKQTLYALGNLTRCEPATHEEGLYFIEHHRLMGRGIGYIEISLLVAARLSAARLWTLDRRLTTVAEELDLVHFQT